MIPEGWVKTKTNNHSQCGFCPQRTLGIWAAETPHGAWTHSSVELVTSKIVFKPYHTNGLQSPQQQLFAETTAGGDESDQKEQFSVIDHLFCL